VEEDGRMGRAGGREMMVGPAARYRCGAFKFDREFPKRRTLSNSTLREKILFAGPI
jgi:hypothetical protein